MATQMTRRRFVPEPIETISRSSNDAKKSTGLSFSRQLPLPCEVQPNEEDQRTAEEGNKHSLQKEFVKDTPAPSSARKVARKFVIQPIEVNVRRSEQISRNVLDDKSEPESDRKPKSFATEAMETSVKQSKHDDVSPKPVPAPRKFAVQPIETTQKSHRDGTEEASPPRRRFAPEPVEGTERRRRSARVPARRTSELDETPADIPIIRSSPKSVRKFAVELIDTSARSRRATDDKFPTLHNFETDVTPSHTINADGHSIFPTTFLRRKPLLHERRRDKRHSFIAPDLETIASSEEDQSEAGRSDRSAANSLTQDSPLTTSDSLPKTKLNIEESATAGMVSGPAFSQFLLDAERKRAEQILQEQALAAFPNSDFHEPVEHYMDNEDRESDTIDDRPTTWEGHDDDVGMQLPAVPVSDRKQTSRINWELIELQKHHESLEQKRLAAEAVANAKSAPSSPWWNEGIVKELAASGPDTELSQMRKGARPPMLGTDLAFPRSSSPEPARFDTTQASHAQGSRMCPLTEQANAQRGSNRTVNGLWGAPGTLSASSTESKGLWGGFCAMRTESTSQETSALPSGMITPALFDQDDPFEETINACTAKVSPSGLLRPPTPPHTRSKGNTNNAVNVKELTPKNTERDLDEIMERDYPDEFVTQVFNYLSLGYPTLARPFDEELSKMTSVTVAELRQDDVMARNMPKGYIRIGEDFQGRQDGSSQELDENKCARWRALKIYIREWAKQEKGMIHVGAPPPYGAAPRKGSWAW